MKIKFDIEKLNTKILFKLESGKEIQDCEIAYKTYGKLNKKKKNQWDFNMSRTNR